MSDLSSPNWNEVDASNNVAPPEGWPEGMMPSGVNDAARADKGGLKRFWNRINPVQAISPVGGIWTFVTANTAYPTAYVNGEVYTFKATAASANGDQFQVNGLAALPIYVVRAGTVVNAIQANDIVQYQQPYLVYDSALNAGAGGFVLTNPTLPAYMAGGSLYIPGSAQVGGTLSATTLQGGTLTAGNTSISGTLGVTGATTLGAAYSSAFTCGGTTVTQQLTVQGSAGFLAGATVTGNLTAGSINTAGTAGLQNLTVPGTSQLTTATLGAATIATSLTMSGGAVANLLNTDISGTLDAYGVSTFHATAHFTQPVQCDATVAVSGGLTVNGATVLGTGGQTMTQLLNVNGSSSPVQISSVSGSALNLRMDNGGSILYLLYQASTYVGGINITSTGSSFAPSSDGRLKENIAPLDPLVVAAVIDGLEPITFDWTHGAEEDRADCGFVAQDVYKLVPRAAFPGTGEPGEEGFHPWSLDQSKLIPFLVAELQRLRARLATVEAALAVR